EKIDGQFEKCPVELNNSQEEVYLETLTLQQLLSLNLVIPDYQRIYCWDEKTIRTLWDDIQEISDSEQYRLGTIILQKKKDSYDIIGTTVRNSVLKPACISSNFAVKIELWTKWNYTGRFSHPSVHSVPKGNSLRHSMPTVRLME
ncbi:MAG TPA: DUF262 domain-containing protein, partial [Candidatus Avibacteroides excrementipullorum]|nr:DUF262 domain-containing protein [Candidatus Avibacteroides excrementipullorum]